MIATSIDIVSIQPIHEVTLVSGRHCRRFSELFVDLYQMWRARSETQHIGRQSIDVMLSTSGSEYGICPTQPL
jgi:hypothetical protein